ncbi:MAG: DUF4838 domain-containing protein [Pirellulaceae bacterium]|nr:DUF4838 domain-containing protein [Pirellulaceae bacterium]
MKLSKESVIKNQQFENETLSLAFAELVSMLDRSAGISVCDKTGMDVVFDLSDSNAYSVVVDGNSLIFKGPSEIEILYAVYTFAEEVLGFCFFEPGHDRFNAKVSIDLDDGTVISPRQPLLKNRGFIQEFPFINRNYELADWMAKNRLNYLLTWMKYYDEFPEEAKHYYRVRGITIESGHHNFNYWLPTDEFYDEHPEYFAIVDGKRVEPKWLGDGTMLSLQLCTTHPEVRAIIAERMIRYCKEHPELKLISLIPTDGFGWCECERCRSFYDQSKKGDRHTISKHVYEAQELYHDLIKDIWSRIKDELPEVVLTLGAYINYAKPAKSFTLDRRMGVHFALYWRCINHQVSDDTCPINSAYAKDLKAWTAARKGGEINIYEYYMGVNFYISLPMVHHEACFDEIRFFNENNIDGLTTQFHLVHWTAYGLNYYLMGKAMYGEEKQEAVDGAFRAIFEKDAEEAKQFYREVKDLVLSAGPCHIPYPRSILRRTELSRYKSLFDKAKALAAKAPQDRLRQRMVVWTEYILRFKGLYDRYAAGKENITEDINQFLDWARDHKKEGVFLMRTVELFCAGWLERIEQGKPWYHFQFDWEDEYIKEHDTLLTEMK